MTGSGFHILINLSWLSVLFLTALGLGRTVLTVSGIRFRSYGEESLFSSGIGFGVLSYSVFLLGVCDGLYPISIWLLLIISLLISAGSLIFSPPSSERSELKRSPGRPVDYLMLLLLGVLILAGICLIQTPAIGNDTLSYHLAVPKRFLQYHGFHFIPGNIFSHYPLGTEMLYIIGLVMGDDRTAKGIHAIFALLTLFGIGQLMKNSIFRDTGNGSAFPVMLFFTIPSVFITAHMAYSDLSYTLYTFLAVYAFLNWYDGKNDRWIAFCGVFSGLGVATKYAGLLVPFMAILGILIVCRYDRIDNRQTLKLLLFYLVLTIIIGSPFYIRNWVVTGNPLYPFFYKIFGGIGWDIDQSRRYDLFHRGLGMGREWVDYLMLPWNLSFHAKMNSPRFDGLLGPIFIWVLPFGLFMRRIKPEVKIMVAYCAITSIFWAASVQQVRYLIPAMPFLSILAAYTVVDFGRIKSVQILLIASVVAGTLLNGYHIADYLNRIRPIQFIMGSETREAFYNRHIPSYGMYRHINTHLSTGSKTLLIYMKNFGYLSDRLYYSDSIFESHMLEKILSAAGTPKAVYSSLAEQKFTHILYDIRYVFGNRSTFSERNKSMFALFQKQYLKLLRSDQKRYYLYEIQLPPAKLE